MRLDFVRERREWEDRMRRAAEMGGLVEVLDDEEMNLEQDDPTNGEDEGAMITPPSPELELVSSGAGQERSDSDWIEKATSHQQRTGQGHNHHQYGYRSDVSDDEDYDEIFNHIVLSQGSDDVTFSNPSQPDRGSFRQLEPRHEQEQQQKQPQAQGQDIEMS